MAEIPMETATFVETLRDRIPAVWDKSELALQKGDRLCLIRGSVAAAAFGNGFRPFFVEVAFGTMDDLPAPGSFPYVASITESVRGYAVYDKNPQGDPKQWLQGCYRRDDPSLDRVVLGSGHALTARFEPEGSFNDVCADIVCQPPVVTRSGEEIAFKGLIDASAFRRGRYGLRKPRAAVQALSRLLVPSSKYAAWLAAELLPAGRTLPVPDSQRTA